MQRQMSNKVPRVPISGMPRKSPTHLDKVTVINPDTGEERTVLRQNANDMVRHSGWQWPEGAPPNRSGSVQLADGRVIPPVDREKTNANAEAKASKEGSAEDKLDAAAAPKEDSDATETEAGHAGEVQCGSSAGQALENLRGEAEALGVVIDKRWGLKRLKKEIEAKA